jgi:hypothetical protein
MKRYVAGGNCNEHREFYGVLFAVVFVALLGATACRRPTTATDGISVHQEITPQPVRVGVTTVAIQLSDTTAKAIPHASIVVEGDMSHPGMAPIFNDAKEIAPGDYQAHIDFNMGGDWVLLLHIKLANGQRVERQVDVRGVRSN